MIAVGLQARLVEMKTERVTKSLEPAYQRFLTWVGTDSMRAAKRLIRPAKQKRISELTEQELAVFRHQQQLWKSGMLSLKPRRPDANANPGEPPRRHGRFSPLRDGRTGIRFAVTKAHSVVIGPSLHGDNAAADIERRHPFMSPALRKVIPRIPGIFERATKRG